MRIAILGAGWAGSTHAAAYARLAKTEDVEIAGIVSRKRAKAEALAKQVGSTGLTDAAKVLGDDAIDAVDITVPSGLHRRFAVAALNRGKHVFVETPMALTLADADAMIRAAKANRKLLLVARLTRVVAENIFAHEAVERGEMGRPRVVIARRLSPPYWSAKNPRPFALYGEPIVELMVFDFDAANWFLGRPRRVWASGISGRGGASEHTIATVEYDGGRALLEGSARMPRSFAFTASLRVVCERGMFDFTFRFTGKPETEFIRYPATGTPEPVPIAKYDPYEEECRHFVRCVQGKADPSRLSAAGERDALRLAIAARAAIRTGAVKPM